MKKIFALVLVLALLCVSCAALATDSAFNPDNEDGVTIEEIREQFGPVPKPADGTILGAVAKQFQNEYWRTLKEGYEEAAKKAAEAGVNIEINVQAA